MRILPIATAVGLGLLAGTAATGHAQNYNYYGWPNTYSWSPYNYPGYQTGISGQEHIGTPMSRRARIRIMRARRRAVTAAHRSIDTK
jgi:hypothetical protein